MGKKGKGKKGGQQEPQSSASGSQLSGQSEQSQTSVPSSSQGEPPRQQRQQQPSSSDDRGGGEGEFQQKKKGSQRKGDHQGGGGQKPGGGGPPSQQQGERSGEEGQKSQQGAGGPRSQQQGGKKGQQGERQGGHGPQQGGGGPKPQQQGGKKGQQGERQEGPGTQQGAGGPRPQQQQGDKKSQQGEKQWGQGPQQGGGGQRPQQEHKQGGDERSQQGEKQGWRERPQQGERQGGQGRQQGGPRPQQEARQGDQRSQQGEKQGWGGSRPQQGERQGGQQGPQQGGAGPRPQQGHGQGGGDQRPQQGGKQGWGGSRQQQQGKQGRGGEQAEQWRQSTPRDQQRGPQGQPQQVQQPPAQQPQPQQQKQGPASAWGQRPGAPPAQAPFAWGQKPPQQPQQQVPGQGPPPGWPQQKQPPSQGPPPGLPQQQQPPRQGEPIGQTASSEGIRETPSQQKGKKGGAKGPPAGPPAQKPSIPTPSPSMQSLTEELGAVALRSPYTVAPGKNGRRIIIETNHLKLDIGKLKTAIHYDVAITPDTPKKFLRPVMDLFRAQHYPRNFPAFDGRKNLYSSKILPFGMSVSGEVVIEDERPRTFQVDVKFAKEVDLTPLHNLNMSQMTPQEALQCVDIVLRNAPSKSCISVGRSFFTPPINQFIDLGQGMQMYYGFYQSAIRGWKPLFNVDVAHKAFPKPMNIIDLILELCNVRNDDLKRQELRSNDCETVSRYLRQLRITYEIPRQPGSRRAYRVNGLRECSRKAKFQQDGQSVTVEQYFRTEKRYNLEYPFMPTLWVGSMQRPSPILLPAELCIVQADQAVARKMTDRQTSNMIRQAATNTSVRKTKIMNALQKANHNNDECMKEFGFSIGKDFEKIAARVLAAPTLSYGQGQSVQVSKGVWRQDDRMKFLIPAHINKWTIIVADYRPCRVEELADMVYRFSGQCGIQLAERATNPGEKVSGRQSFEDVKALLQKYKTFDLIFVVVPDGGPAYSHVKRAAELHLGCLTQCIKSRTLQRLNPSTVQNILLKVNSKRRGTNHCLRSRPPFMQRPCMIMGADVTHPSPDARNIPSVAAVTASYDVNAFCYNICCRLQPPKVEIIEDLKEITREHLMYFYKLNKQNKPEKIIFFRDGVSEGQFDQVRDAEIRAIRSACASLGNGEYEPQITFLVVQKRHHTRFFPTNPKDSEDKNINVPAGTCVDTDITNPTMQDFYLVSHASIQGVAKPTKYCTLWDDNDLSNDDIEALTYHLCHLFARCNRSVSYPAPTYYAHLAAARAKVYIENINIDMTDLKEQQKHIAILDQVRKELPMFFV